MATTVTVYSWLPDVGVGSEILTLEVLFGVIVPVGEADHEYVNVRPVGPCAVAVTVFAQGPQAPEIGEKSTVGFARTVNV